MLKKRVLSGLIGALVALLFIYIGGLWYFFIVAALALLSLEEYYNFSLKGNYYFPRNFSFLTALIYLYLLYIQFPLILEISPLIIFLPLCIYFLFQDRFKLRDLTFATWGFIYIIWFFGFLLALRFLPQGLSYTMLLFVSIWINDTAAFFTGSYLGKNKLLPRISPNKTVEGSIGGVLATSLFVLIVRGYLDLGLFTALMLGFLISLSGQLGDLLESALKRHLELKDSGEIIPGHGGILDRFDSILLSAPLFYFYIKFLKQML
ncbi:MAG: phosphatidate cytidylyltransferase [Candidatus Syntrophonatronum acetioxidans]|uniref:Phosphatidate cytidylyltransferase n=1 Tax=Candidatus Syntrophonatronum acetioxidans TaxID=1795816 RepID=A0A424YEB8_9FIRM|nr:MAG: phosphatidate cytidylyltransferase [Candidatus Syntrophonatronum acetioxidans]